MSRRMVALTVLALTGAALVLPEPTFARATWVTCRSLPNSPCEPRGHLASARPRHASEVHQAANRVDLSCVLIAASTASPLVDRVS